jgi:predicted O-methyltransferase YrrM
MEMTPERWDYTRDYLGRTFGAQDEHLSGLMDDAASRGIPAIAVSAEVGRLLTLLTSTTPGRLAIEVGTLAGYSAIWLARGLREGGKLHTIELKDEHADFAEEQYAKAGVADRVVQERGSGLDVLERLAKELEPGSVDVVFLDAVKTEYPEYFRIARPLIAKGGWLIGDNVLGAGSWWIDAEDNDSRNAVDELNRTVAADPDFEATCVPLREGLLLARRVR